MDKYLIFTAKIIAYLFVAFLWFRMAFPFLISYPDTFVVMIGFIGSVIFVLLWVYFISKTINKFLVKLNKNENN